MKRLRKSRDSKISGVCGGLGEYLGIDPTIIRILFLGALVMFGSGFVLYLILWLVMPDPE